MKIHLLKMIYQVKQNEPKMKMNSKYYLHKLSQASIHVNMCLYQTIIKLKYSPNLIEIIKILLISKILNKIKLN